MVLTVSAKPGLWFSPECIVGLFSWSLANCLVGSKACSLTFGDPSIQPPDVESIIKINSGQTVASFSGLPKFSLLGEDREQR